MLPDPNPSVSATHARNIPEIVRPPVLAMLGMRVVPSDAACEDIDVPGVDMHGVKSSALSVDLALQAALPPAGTFTATMLGVNSAFGGGADMSGANSEPTPRALDSCVTQEWKTFELRGSKCAGLAWSRSMPKPEALRL